MRRTVGKLAMNKATFLSLSNQMTEQLGALAGSGLTLGLLTRVGPVAPALPKRKEQLQIF